MPTIFIEGYKFRFYSSDRVEPPHVQVIHGENVAKIRLSPVAVEYNYGYNRSELNRIVRLTEASRTRLLKAWHDYFSR